MKRLQVKPLPRRECTWQVLVPLVPWTASGGHHQRFGDSSWHIPCQNHLETLDDWSSRRRKFVPRHRFSLKTQVTYLDIVFGNDCHVTCSVQSSLHSTDCWTVPLDRMVVRVVMELYSPIQRLVGLEAVSAVDANLIRSWLRYASAVVEQWCPWALKNRWCVGERNSGFPSGCVGWSHSWW